MKTPSNKEEFLVWPPIGGGAGLFVGATAFDLFHLHHTHLLRQDDSPLYTGYLFPLLMAFAFAWRLHSKYWLGFAWVGFASYLIAWGLSWFAHREGLLSSAFILFTSLSMMFGVQSLLLYLERFRRFPWH